MINKKSNTEVTIDVLEYCASKIAATVTRNLKEMEDGHVEDSHWEIECCSHLYAILKEARIVRELVEQNL